MPSAASASAPPLRRHAASSCAAIAAASTSTVASERDPIQPPVRATRRRACARAPRRARRAAAATPRHGRVRGGPLPLPRAASPGIDIGCVGRESIAHGSSPRRAGNPAAHRGASERKRRRCGSEALHHGAQDREGGLDESQALIAVAERRERLAARRHPHDQGALRIDASDRLHATIGIFEQRREHLVELLRETESRHAPRLHEERHEFAEAGVGLVRRETRGHLDRARIGREWKIRRCDRRAKQRLERGALEGRIREQACGTPNSGQVLRPSRRARTPRSPELFSLSVLRPAAARRSARRSVAAIQYRGASFSPSACSTHRAASPDFPRAPGGFRCAQCERAQRHTDERTSRDRAARETPRARDRDLAPLELHLGDAQARGGSEAGIGRLREFLRRSRLHVWRRPAKKSASAAHEVRCGDQRRVADRFGVLRALECVGGCFGKEAERQRESRRGQCSAGANLSRPRRTASPARVPRARPHPIRAGLEPSGWPHRARPRGPARGTPLRAARRSAACAAPRRRAAATDPAAARRQPVAPRAAPSRAPRPRVRGRSLRIPGAPAGRELESIHQTHDRVAIALVDQPVLDRDPVRPRRESRGPAHGSRGARRREGGSRPGRRLLGSRRPDRSRCGCRPRRAPRGAAPSDRAAPRSSGLRGTARDRACTRCSAGR